MKEKETQKSEEGQAGASENVSRRDFLMKSAVGAGAAAAALGSVERVLGADDSSTSTESGRKIRIPDEWKDVLPLDSPWRFYWEAELE